MGGKELVYSAKKHSSQGRLRVKPSRVSKKYIAFGVEQERQLGVVLNEKNGLRFFLTTQPGG